MRKISHVEFGLTNFERDLKYIVTNSFNLFEFEWFVNEIEILTLISNYFLSWISRLIPSNHILQSKRNFKLMLLFKHSVKKKIEEKNTLLSNFTFGPRYFKVDKINIKVSILNTSNPNRLRTSTANNGLD